MKALSDKQLREIRGKFREQRQSSRQRFSSEAAAIRESYRAEKGNIRGYKKSGEYKAAEKRESQRQRQYNTRERKAVVAYAETAAGIRPETQPDKRSKIAGGTGAPDIPTAVKRQAAADVERVPETPFWNMPSIAADQITGAPAAVVKVRIEGEKGTSFDMKKPGDFYKLTKALKGLYKRFMKDATGKNALYWVGKATTITLKDGTQVIKIEFRRDSKRETAKKPKTNRKGRNF